MEVGILVSWKVRSLRAPEAASKAQISARRSYNSHSAYQSVAQGEINME
jgi:hypothetical protein